MTALSDAELLELWERGSTQHPLDRALTMLALGSGRPRSELAALDLGQRDALLFAQRERWFGAALAASVRCPACGDERELGLDTRTLSPHPAGGVEDGARRVAVDAGGYHAVVRVPTTLDLADLVRNRVPDLTRALLRRCVVEADGAGGARAGDELPEPLVAAIEDALDRLRPSPDTSLRLSCPDCDHAWQVGFDIGEYLWLEVERAARAILQLVAELAAAYGWTEAEVLAIGPRRRRAYRELISS